jgi:alpha-tubulin suppressor-like RCC1 family protein
MTTTPTPPKISSLSGIVAIAAGSTSSYAKSESGTVYAWGSNLWPARQWFDQQEQYTGQCAGSV